jgi:hypothetical protein
MFVGLISLQICRAEPAFHLFDQWKTDDGMSYSKLYSDPEYFIDQVNA